jgi:hypothetical protein
MGRTKKNVKKVEETDTQDDSPMLTQNQAMHTDSSVADKLLNYDANEYTVTINIGDHATIKYVCDSRKDLSHKLTKLVRSIRAVEVLMTD